MAESTLSRQFDDIATELAFYLGYGRTAYGSLSTARAAAVLAYIKSGLRQAFVSPPKLPGERVAHEWSFMRPVTTIVLWSTQTGTASGAPVKDNGTSTVTSAAAMFYPSMIGKSVAFTATGNTYEITAYTSSTVVTVSGDASGEANGDTLTVTANGDYRLPDAFGGILGPLTYPADSGYVPIQQRNESQIRAYRQTTSGTSQPQLYATRPVQHSTVTAGQRYELMAWPTPGTNYTLSYRFAVNIDSITTGQYPVGGLPYGELLMESCLAIAEQRINDTESTHSKKFMDALAAAVEVDRSANEAQTLGCNSDNYGRLTRADKVFSVLYNGTQY